MTERKNRMTAVISIIFACAAATADESPTAYGRWAIIASPELRETGLADLALLRVQQMGLELVERDELDRILEEIDLADLFGADQHAGRLEAGRLLSADALLIMRTANGKTSDPKRLELVIGDCSYGARLRVDTIEYNPERIDDTLNAIMGCIRELTEQYPNGVERIVCVPPFVSRSLEDKHDYLQSRLAFVIQAALAGYTGTAMLEVNEAQSIQHELDLSGDEIRRAATPLFIEGEYRVGWNADRKANDYDVAIRVVGRAGKQVEYRETYANEDALTKGIQTYFVENMLVPLFSTELRAVPDAVRIARLANRADAFLRLGRIDEAIEMREALLLLHPERQDQILRLLENYTQRFKQRAVRVPFNWTIDPTDVVPKWSQQLKCWRRALDILGRAIGREALTQFQALDALDALEDALSEFASGVLPRVEVRGGDPEAWAPLDDQFSACVSRHRQFMTDEFPAVRRLPIGKTALALQYHVGEPRPEISVYARWLGAQIRSPAFSPSWSSENPTAENLQRMAYVLTTRAEDSPILCAAVLDVIRSACLRNSESTGVSDSQLEGVIEMLEASSLRINRHYGEIARVLFRFKRAPDGERTDTGETSKALHALADRVRPELEVESQRLLDFFVSNIERTINERGRSSRTDAPNRGDVAPLPPRVKPTPRLLRSTPAPMQIRRLSGETMSMHRQEWAGTSGYVDIAGTWLRLVPCGTVDVMYNAYMVALHERPGECRELLFTRNRPGSRRSVHWDGQSIWIGDVDGGIWVIRPDGTTVTRVTPEHGLPAYDGGLLIEPVEPGRVIAVGGIEDNQRVWIAEITLSQTDPELRILHESTVRYSDQRNQTQDLGDTEVTFQPTDIHRLRDPLDGGRPYMLIERSTSRRWPLRLDLESGAVSSIGIGLRDQIPTEFTGTFQFLTNGDILIVDRENDLLKLCAGPGRLLDGQAAERNLYQQPEIAFWGSLIEYDGWWYAPGKEWVRIDPETLDSVRLGPGVLGQMEPGSGRGWSVSAHYGLIAWDNEWRFHRIEDTAPVGGDVHADPVNYIHVRDHESGAPIEGAEVIVRRGQRETSMRADDAGDATVTQAARDGAGFRVEVHANGYWSRTLAVHGSRAEIDGSKLTVDLEHVLKIGGAITNADGEPITGKQVCVLRRTQNTSDDVANLIVDLDERGRWSAALPPADPRTLSLILTDPMTVTSSGRGWDRSLAKWRARFDLDGNTNSDVIESLLRGEHRWQVDVEQRGSRLVRVVDEGGAPVPNGVAEIHKPGTEEVRRVPFLDGILDLSTEQRSGRITLLLRAEGLAPMSFTVTRGHLPREVKLERALPLEIVVVTSDDDPVSSARVVCELDGIFLLDAMTDIHGRVVWEDAPLNAPDVTVSKTGWRADPVQTRPSARKLVFVLNERTVQTITLRVVDSKTEEPVLKFDVLRNRNTQSSRGGAYTLRLGSDQECSLTVSAPGYVSQRVKVVGDGDAERVVRLNKGEAITGVLRLADGSPLPNVEIALASRRWPTRIKESNKLEARETTTTDSEGGFAFPPTNGVGQIIYYGAHGYGEFDRQGLAAGSDLVIQPPGRIEGICTITAEAGSQPTVLWTAMVEKGEARILRQFSLSAEIDDDGRFVLENVPPIEGWLSLKQAAFLQNGDFKKQSYWNHSGVQSVSARAGETVNIELRATGRPVIGRLVLAPRRDRLRKLRVQIGPIRQSADRHPWAPGVVLADRDGVFEFPDVLPGDYQLSAQPGFQSRKITIPEADSAAPYDLGTIEPTPQKSSAAPTRQEPPELTLRAGRGSEMFAWVRPAAIGALVIAGGWSLKRKLAAKG